VLVLRLDVPAFTFVPVLWFAVLGCLRLRLFVAVAGFVWLICSVPVTVYVTAPRALPYVCCVATAFCRSLLWFTWFPDLVPMLVGSLGWLRWFTRFVCWLRL